MKILRANNNLMIVVYFVGSKKLIRYIRVEVLRKGTMKEAVDSFGVSNS